MGLHRTQTTNNDNEDERESTPALNILSQMIAITTFLCFYISTLLTLKALKHVSFRTKKYFHHNTIYGVFSGMHNVIFTLHSYLTVAQT